MTAHGAGKQMVSPERLAGLEHGWLGLAEVYGVEPLAALPVFDDLCAAHSEPHRHYHTLEHVSEVLRVSGRLSRFAADPGAVRLAVWFHDVVYDPQATDNEASSAERAVEWLSVARFPPAVVGRVRELILSTTHTGTPADADAAVLCDADLAILGAAETRYGRYAADIRREYARVPEAEYRAGRVRVLQSFLARPHIYSTPVMREEGESAARRNLAAEIDALST
jgi:predicted metal-dependent HD superfamily phosphohydrolase